MVVRGAPAIGIAAAYGLALAAHGARTSRRRTRCCARRGRRPSTSPGRSTRCTPTRPPSGRGRSIATRSSAAARCRRTLRGCSPRDARAHALQRRRPGDRGLRERRRRAARGVGAGPAGARVGRRDPAAPAGRPADGVGARDSRDPACGHRRLGRGVADGGRRGRRRLHGRRPDRRQRRHGQQDRHVRARGARERTTRTVLRRRPELDCRPCDGDGAGIPIEERDPAELTERFGRAIPRST